VRTEPVAAAAGPAELELSLPVRGIGPDQLWELMWRRRLQTEWLGATAAVALEVDCRFTLGDGAGAWRGGRVRRAKGRRLEAALLPAGGRPGGAGTALSISVQPDGDGSLLRIGESFFADEAQREESRLYWQGALDRLRGLVAAARSRRDRPRQAILIIHGIGEQEPGRTLRAFVRSGVVSPNTADRWVRPDRISGSFELRSVMFEATAGREMPTTDVFELYWAHVIRDTTLAQVAGWARGLLLRRAVPRPLRPAWLLGWAVAALVLAAIVVQALLATGVAPWLATAGIVIVALGLLWRLGRGLALNYLGDAARYLSPRPANIAHRQAVRQAGVDLLERLHEDPRYDRIVLLGHSLGSVIAYDVVTHAWIRMHQRHRSPRAPSFTAVAGLERAIGSETDADGAQALQHEAWKEQRRNTQPWLVTDLVTVGSPLTYADFLMKAGREELEQEVADRVLPACPPVTEVEAKSGHRRCSFARPYRDDMGAKTGTFTVFNHGAPFAVTRWTNLWFRSRWLGFVGDPVGGPVAPQLGAWVKDVELEPPARRFTHTWYWRPVEGGSAHLDALRRAIAPAAGAELTELAVETPAFVSAERALRRD
jgi:hypothetical protein